MVASLQILRHKLLISHLIPQYVSSQLIERSRNHSAPRKTFLELFSRRLYTTFTWRRTCYL